MKFARCFPSSSLLYGSLVLLLVVPHFLRPAPLAAQEVSLSDDAYHYRLWAEGQHNANYTEWWYFNLSDPQNGLHAVFSYLVSNPDNLAGIGFSQLTAVAYTANGVLTENDKYPVSAFSASYDLANVQVGWNSVHVTGSLYEIKGSSRDGRLVWDLLYQRQADPWYAATHMTVGSLPWEQMDWLIDMPRAQVNGLLLVDGQLFTVRGQAGYHDHNWGEWIPFDALWNWAQYSQPGFSLELGDFIGRPAGLIGMNLQGQRTVFTKDQYRLIHLQWALDPGSLLFYPTASLLLAQNDSSALVLVMRVGKTDPLRGDLPFPLPDVFVFEQTTDYAGQVWQKDAKGQWQLELPFSGDGFKEYTAKQY